MTKLENITSTYSGYNQDNDLYVNISNFKIDAFNQIKQLLKSHYNKAGVSSEIDNFTFNDNNNLQLNVYRLVEKTEEKNQTTDDDDDNTSVVDDIEITEKLSISPGWNLISIPLYDLKYYEDGYFNLDEFKNKYSSIKAIFAWVNNEWLFWRPDGSIKMSSFQYGYGHWILSDGSTPINIGYRS